MKPAVYTSYPRSSFTLFPSLHFPNNTFFLTIPRLISILLVYLLLTVSASLYISHPRNTFTATLYSSTHGKTNATFFFFFYLAPLVSSNVLQAIDSYSRPQNTATVSSHLTKLHARLVSYLDPLYVCCALMRIAGYRYLFISHPQNTTLQTFFFLTPTKLHAALPSSIIPLHFLCYM